VFQVLLFVALEKEKKLLFALSVRNKTISPARHNHSNLRSHIRHLEKHTTLKTFSLSITEI